MLSFHNDAELKNKIVKRLAAHHEADQIIQGTGWDGSRGCAVGCTLENYSHAAYEEELGLPQWIAHLEDKIFEGLPAEKAPQFAHDFLSAIPVGVNVEPVRWKLAILRHKRDLARLEGNTEEYAQQCRDAINGTIAYCEQQHVGFSDESAARSAAWSAESAAESAARSAAWSARSAAESARSAAWSARSAAESAESAAESARSAAYEWEAATLIQLLKECGR